MRTTLLVCALLANIAVAARLRAQDCETCQDCPAKGACEVSEISILFANPRCECTQGGCPQGDCDQAGCNRDGCKQCAANQAAGNRDECDPYTYYQLREDWRRAHGPVVDTVRYIHQSCPKKHHHCHGNQAAYLRASQTPWHGAYYYPQWGAPVPLVVPPTAEFQTNYSWGVPASRISPIDHQFSRSYPGYGPGVVGGYGFLPPPLQPNDTNQFGVYYVRGPW